MNMMDGNQFLRFHALGYTRLVPIIPPDAKISEKSSLYKRVGTHQDARGKTPGVKNRDGLWSGFDWLPYECDEDDLGRWHRMGAGVGIKTGDGLVLIDADTTNPEWAKLIYDQLTLLIKPPVRIGNKPKAGYLVRTDPDFKYTRIEFGERNEKGNLTERVEILADGRQFVASGIHPKTKQPYAWPHGIPDYDALPYLAPELLTAFLETLRNKLPAASPLIREGAQTDINQKSLAGPLEAVRKAVRAIPNNSEMFPSRESYRDFGYAIKAALPDNAQEAYDLFAEWCARWQDGENDSDIVEADWRRMKPPFRRGAGWLYELAEQHGKFSQAEVWFDQLPDPTENPFAEIRGSSQHNTGTYQLLTIGELMHRPPPTWLINRHIPDQSVGFLYSEPGAGKSFLALDMALSVAHGLDNWQGDPIKQDPNPAVVYIAAEGAFDFGLRIKAWHKAKGLKADACKNFYIIEQTINFMKSDDVEKLVRTLSGLTPTLRPVLVVVDTVSRALPGADENLQKDMTLFVRACDAVRDTFSCAVLGIHHAGKSGDMRGSTVLLGAGDFVFKLERRKGATMGVLTCEKQKAAPDGWNEPYRFDVVQLEDGGSSLVAVRAEAGFGPAVELTPDVSASVLGAMRAAWEEGRPWSKAPQSGDRYAIRHMVSDFGFEGVRAEETLLLWEQTGLISMETMSGHSKMRGYKVVGDIGHDVRNEDIFG
jgi:hypothetical protein